MTVYQDTIDSLSAGRTLTAHITNLIKLQNKTEDETLKRLLGNVVGQLQAAHKSPKILGKTTPGAIVNFKNAGVPELVVYCKKTIGTQKPEWQIEAERHGWAPKQQ